MAAQTNILVNLFDGEEIPGIVYEGDKAVIHDFTALKQWANEEGNIIFKEVGRDKETGRTYLKLVDVDKERYRKQKRGRSRSNKPKTIIVRPQIGKHDLERKVRQAEKFLASGHPVVVQVDARGRLSQRGDIIKDILKRFTEISANGYNLKTKFDAEKFRVSLFPMGKHRPKS